MRCPEAISQSSPLTRGCGEAQRLAVRQRRGPDRPPARQRHRVVRNGDGRVRALRRAPDRRAARKMRKMPAASGVDSSPIDATVCRRRRGGIVGRGQKRRELIHARCARSDAAWRRRRRPRHRGACLVRGFLAADAQHAVLVFVEHIPDPGNGRLALHDFGGEIAAHVIGGSAFARDDGEAARLRFFIEVLPRACRIALAAGRRSNRRRRWRRAAARSTPSVARRWCRRIARERRRRQQANATDKPHSAMRRHARHCN